jgi:hypothetical protein
VIPGLDDERFVASDYTPIRAALLAAAEIREELAEIPIWEVRLGYDGVIVLDMLGVREAAEAALLLGLVDRQETRKGVGYQGTWRGADLRVIAEKPSRVVGAWLRVTGRLR